MSELARVEHLSILQSDRYLNAGKAVAAMALGVSQLTQEFASVERIPRYADGRRENDVEHSYMLAIAAPEMAQMLGLDLDTNKIRAYSLVHDLLEIEVGDVATFDLDAKQLAEKERREQAARDTLFEKLPLLTAQNFKEYERLSQMHFADYDDSNPEHTYLREAIFTRMVDKLMPVAVDTTGDGIRIMRENFGIKDVDELIVSHEALHIRIRNQYGEDFPDLVAAHAVLCKVFEYAFDQADDYTKPAEKSRGPDEVELKYLIDLAKLPKNIDLSKAKKTYLRQGYIAIGASGSETRVRSYNNERFDITGKTGGTIKRGEKKMSIDQEMFESLWPQTEGRRIHKTRYEIPYGDVIIELDIYEGHLQGLVTAEVEFSGRATEAMVKANTFVPPEWFGEDVSENLQYKGQNLALRLPNEPMHLGSK